MNKQLVSKNLLISYSDLGKKDSSISMLFLHGWRSNKEVWGTVSKLMSQSVSKSVNIYSLDLPGFGGSQNPKAPMTVGDYAEIVVEFIKKLDLKNTIIIGHSFGGRVGIKLAATHPEIINTLILVDSAGFAMDPNKRIVVNTAAKIAKPFFRPKFMQGLRKAIYKHIGAEDYLATPELQQTFVNITSEDLSVDMATIKCPTLIITGQDDNDTPVEFGDLMHSIIPNSKFVIIKDAGHFSFLDKPEEFINNLLKFI